MVTKQCPGVIVWERVCKHVTDVDSVLRITDPNSIATFTTWTVGTKTIMCYIHLSQLLWYGLWVKYRGLLVTKNKAMRILLVLIHTITTPHGRRATLNSHAAVMLCLLATPPLQWRATAGPSPPPLTYEVIQPRAERKPAKWYNTAQYIGLSWQLKFM